MLPEFFVSAVPNMKFLILVASIVVFPSLAVAGQSGVAAEAQQCSEADLPVGVELEDATLRRTPSGIPFVRTPGERFLDLEGYRFEPNYVDIGGGLRMHYLDEGPADGEIVLLLHGQPAWSYLYRRMIPVIADAGYRVVVPDLIGTGRSDKPTRFCDYSYLNHVAWAEEFVHVLELQDVTLFGQDWGAQIGLRMVGNRPEDYARVVVANGRLPVIPTGHILVPGLPDPPVLDPELPDPFETYKLADPEESLRAFALVVRYALTSPNFTAGRVLQAATATDLTPGEIAAYDAPFPSLVYMTGIRAFPSLINTLGEEPTNHSARAVLDAWEKPFLTFAGRLDRLVGTEAVQAELRDTVPGAVGWPHHAYEDADHYIQEDTGEDLARRVVAFLAASPGTAATQ